MDSFNKIYKSAFRDELTKTAMPPNAEFVKNIQRSILKGPHANKEIVKRFLHSNTGINIGNLQRSKSSLVSKNFFPIIKK
jgi:hypothetical protein